MILPFALQRSAFRLATMPSPLPLARQSTRLPCWPQAQQLRQATQSLFNAPARQLARQKNGSSPRSGTSSFSSSSSYSSRLWYMAAAMPLVAVSSHDQPQATDSAASWMPYSRYDLPLNPEAVAEISKGSVTGFVLGLFVSVFSKTLVLLLGIAITVQNLAERAGIDLVRYFKLKERLNSSRILDSLAEHTAFKLAFGITFTLAAFVQF